MTISANDAKGNAPVAFCQGPVTTCSGGAQGNAHPLRFDPRLIPFGSCFPRAICGMIYVRCSIRCSCERLGYAALSMWVLLRCCVARRLTPETHRERSPFTPCRTARGLHSVLHTTAACRYTLSTRIRTTRGQ
eukprot:1187870-Prorocentrum_minimum.AAC.5